MKNDLAILEENTEHERVCFTCSDDIERWVKGIIARGEAYRYDFLGWPDDLWNRTAAEALAYIAGRFEDTEDAREYYVSMLYLTKRIDAKELFIPWKESSNYRTVLAKQSEQNGQGDTNIAPQKTRSITIGKMNKNDLKRAETTKFNSLKNRL